MKSKWWGEERFRGSGFSDLHFLIWENFGDRFIILLLVLVLLNLHIYIICCFIMHVQYIYIMHLTIKKEKSTFLSEWNMCWNNSLPCAVTAHLPKMRATKNLCISNLMHMDDNKTFKYEIQLNKNLNRLTLYWSCC